MPDSLKHINIGTSGWSYDHWRNIFYAGVARKDWLSFYSKRYNTVEVNATFYRQQKKSTFESWRDQTPSAFRFAVKGNRYITHNKKLKDIQQSLLREKHQAMGLKRKLAVVLWQMPVQFKKNVERLIEFAESLESWQSVRHVVEFRHPSWFDGEISQILKKHRIGICQSDAADWPIWTQISTDLVYIRLHGRTHTYVSCYSRKQLSQWADKIIQWNEKKLDVYAYFDNDAKGAALANSLLLMQLLQRKVGSVE